MNKIVILFLIIFPVFLFGQNNSWRIVAAMPYNYSDSSDENYLAEIIQRSVVTILDQVEYYSLTASDEVIKEVGSNTIDDFYSQNYDILVSSYYFVDEDKIYIEVTAVDLVMRQVKFRNSYEGLAGIDVLETIDSIVFNLKEDLSHEVSAMDEDIIVQYRTRTVYEETELSYPREFISSFGLISAMGTGTWPPSPLLGLEIGLKRFGFGGSFFIPVIFATDYYKVFAELHGSFYITPKWKIELGTFIAYALSNREVGFLLPEMSIIFRPNSRWDIGLGIAYAYDTNPDSPVLLFEPTFYFDANNGINLGIYWATAYGSQNGDFKMSLAYVKRAKFD